MEDLQDTSNLSFKEHGDSTDFLDGFQQVFGLSSQEGGSSVSSPSATITEPKGGVAPPVLENYEITENDEDYEEQTVEQEEEDESSTQTSEEEGEEGIEEEEEEHSDEIDSKKKPGDESEESSSSSGDNEADETEIVDSFFDLFSQELGWDYDEQNKPNTISGLVDFINDIISEGSKPSFATNDIEKMNSYVENGGKLEDFIEAYNKDVNLLDLDIENNVENQKRVIREQQKRQGISEERIESKIERYEDTGILAEEALESQELLNNYDDREADKLLREQENAREEQKQQQQKFVRDVKSTIDSMKTIKGIPLTKKQKEDLKSYLFEADNKGMTGYQKDYSKSYGNLIESAFFTMEGDDIVKHLRKKADTDATKNLKNKLNKNRGKRSKAGSSGNSAGSSGRNDSLDTVRRLSKILSS